MGKGDIFDVPTCDYNTSEGMVKLPAFYRDCSIVTGLFLCDYERVANKLENTGLFPAELQKGKALVMLSIYEYRDTTFGPYIEASFITAVYPCSCGKPPFMPLQMFMGADRKKLGYYFIDLSLNASLPCTAGREIWGLPKFITDISFKCDGKDFEGRIPDPKTGENIVTLKAPFGKGVGMPAMDMVFYSNHDDSILKTLVKMSAMIKTTSGKKAELIVGPAKHRMTDNLRDLGLDKTPPFLLQTTDKLKYALYPGEKTEAWSCPELPYGN